jgi:hypothetical protein
LVKPIAKIYSQGFQGKLFHIFLSCIPFLMHFRNLQFSGKFKSKMRFEKRGIVLRPKQAHSSGLLAQCPKMPWLACNDGARCGRGHRVVHTCGRRGDVLATGVTGARRR